MKKLILLFTMLAGLLTTGCGKNESVTDEPTQSPTPTSFVVGTGNTMDVDEIGKIVKVEKIGEGDYNVYFSIEKQECIGDVDSMEPVTNVGDLICVPWVTSVQYEYFGKYLLRYSNSDFFEGEIDYVPEVGDGVIGTYSLIGGWGLSGYDEKDGIKYVGDFEGDDRRQSDYFIFPYDLSGMVTGEVISVMDENSVKIKVNKDRGDFSVGDEITVAYQWSSKRSSKEVLEEAFDTDKKFSHIDYKLDYEDEVQIKEGDVISFKYGKADLNLFKNEQDDTKKKLTPLIVTVVEE
jgi:hypothetical protein